MDFKKTPEYFDYTEGKEIFAWCYVLAPIDYFTDWISVKDFINRCMDIKVRDYKENDYAANAYATSFITALRFFYACVHSHNELNKKFGVLGLDEGRGGLPYFMPIPTTDDEPSCYCVLFKNDNNGATFIYSPYELPSIAKSAECIYELWE